MLNGCRVQSRPTPFASRVSAVPCPPRVTWVLDCSIAALAIGTGANAPLSISARAGHFSAALIIARMPGANRLWQRRPCIHDGGQGGVHLTNVGGHRVGNGGIDIRKPLSHWAL